MHIVLAALGLIVSILFLLSRLADAGIDLGGLNPFLWKRRRAWRRKIEDNPVITLQDPTEVASLLVRQRLRAAKEPDRHSARLPRSRIATRRILGIAT